MLDHLTQNGASIGKAKSGNVLRVDLRNTTIEWTPELLQFLLNSPALREIYLTDLPVNDADCSRLSELEKLKVIDLENTDVTDQVLMALSSLPAIEIINVRGTSISTQAVNDLRKKLINTRIIGP